MGSTRSNTQHRRNKRKSKKKRLDHKKFWGDAASFEVDLFDSLLKITSHPDAVIQSLGNPPLELAHNNTSIVQFSTLYARSVLLASALAAAGGLLEDMTAKE